jgi:flagellar hook-associated protein 1 FlgK
MSTFSGISTALSSLIAQRQGLDVSAQNLANANTVGYTRQRANLASVGGSPVPAMFSTSSGVGTGVQVGSIDRLADAFVDARLRTATSDSTYLAARADTYDTLETSLGEPGTTGLSNQLTSFWSAWQDAANYPNSSANRSVLLTKAQDVVDRLSTLAGAVSTQWSDTRSSTSSLVDQVNATATSVADLNQRILGLSSTGAATGELEDQRDQLITTLSGLVGATGVTREDGQVDVMVGGNALVAGNKVSTITLTGATTYAQAAAGTAIGLQWTDRPTVPVTLSGGTITGNLSALAPPQADGSGGILTEAGARLDSVAATLVSSVNALHSTATTATGSAGGSFFDPAGVTASSITVAITDAADVALANPANGSLDGSIGLQISKLASTTGSPDSLWSNAVVDIGSKTAAATSRSTVAESTRSAIEAQQTSGASVDTDEETVNMLAYQRAYQAAARVMTTIDSVLDTLINRMAV